MNSGQRWAVIVGALLLAAAVGFFAYNSGVSRGIEQSGKIVVAPVAGAGAYAWHGGFFFFPLFFVLFWVFIIRGIFWRGGWHHRRGCYEGGLDEWHRRAHERMWNEPGEPSQK
jgi:hypothetical protein